jgi:hypothetical protein
VTRCRSCGAPIRWAVTVNGKRMPVDDQPTPDGTLVLSDPSPGAYAPTVAQYVEPEQSPLFEVPDPPRFTSHFATCPNADQHRKDRTT